MSAVRNEFTEGPYCIEPHGDGYALYHGRDDNHHGFNLCQLSGFDSNGETTRSLIVDALNKMSNNTCIGCVLSGCVKKDSSRCKTCSRFYSDNFQDPKVQA